MSDDIVTIHPAITKVEGVHQTKELKMPEDLRNKVDRFTPMQKRYGEYRSKGLRQADSASKAGSVAKERAALGRVGYAWEQLEGMKEYIAFLYEKRAQMAVLDEIEIVEKLRANLERALELDRVDWANKTLELMGLMIGAFKTTGVKDNGKKEKPKESRSNVDAFKPEGEEVTQDQRLKDIHAIMTSLNKTKGLMKEVE